MASVHKRKWTSPKGEKKEAWQVRYVDLHGKRRSQTFERKKEADAYCLKVGVELAEKTHIGRSDTVTVDVLLDHYEEACDLRHAAKRRMGDSHLKKIKSEFRLHVRPHLGSEKLTDLTFTKLDGWARLVSKKPQLSPVSAKSVMYDFRVALDFAKRRGWVRDNVLWDVMKEYRGGKAAPIRTFTKADIRKLLHALDHTPGRHSDRNLMMLKGFVYLALFCGMRWGEISGLRVDNLDFKRGVIEIRHSLTFRDHHKEPKTRAGIRNVPLPSMVNDLLKRWLAKFYVPNELGLVFRSATGGFLASSWFHQGHWKPLLERSGLDPLKGQPSFHFHALRHFCASMMVEQGVPLTDAAELLGHRSFDMTLQVYAHAIMASTKRVEILQGIAENLLECEPVPLLQLPDARHAA